ncbi:ABC transporter ATP-binding protein [Paenibacillus sp. NPDC057934]|uniref:ABC transporter ATP-binding protein n=1 Tax=Paenibacillus sp. NPDC057934 TaxID=3346282 RepID=UPI0036D9B813
MSNHSVNFIKNTNNLIELKHVSKKYKTGKITFDALIDASFTVEQGEFVIVLGTSGSGKSTILNILGGMDRASGGEILVDGENIAAYNDQKITAYRRDKVGFVFQSYNLISGLTALENVELGAEVCKDHLNSMEVLERVGLASKKKSFPALLSGGEQQRIAIARAVAKNPLILLCDEPTGALDDETGRNVLSLLEEINSVYQKTILLITHNSLIAPMADKVIRVRSGRVESVVKNENKTMVKDLKW